MTVAIATLLVTSITLLFQVIRTYLQWRQKNINEKQLKHTKDGGDG